MEFFETIKDYVIIFFVSMVPLVELRGAIPISQGMGLPLVPSYIVCIVGNMIPVPIIFFFARKFLEWGADKKYIGKICSFFLRKGAKAGKKLTEKGKKATDSGKTDSSGENEVAAGENESVCDNVDDNGDRDELKSEPRKMNKGLFIALLLFVAIPLPGTGAWTGTLGASMLDMRFRDAVIAVIFGVLIAGVIMMLGSMGVLGGFSALFTKG